MSSYRIIKRGVLFGTEGDPLVRGDYAEKLEDGVIAKLGEAIPVVFGTRLIDPIVVAWTSGQPYTKLYYAVFNRTDDDTGERVRNLQAWGTETLPTFGEGEPGRPLLTERMILLSMRMVLCVGHADQIGPWYANNAIFHVYAEDSPPGQITGVADRLGNVPRDDPPAWRYLRDADNALRTQTGVTRLVVSAGDADMFGGGTEGGLGFPNARQFFNPSTRFYQFWFGTDGIKTPAINQDGGVNYHGVSSLYFNQFNFGGNWTPPRWRVGVSRVQYLTTPDDSTSSDPLEISPTTYKQQWEPVFRGTDRPLASVSTLNRSLENLFYLIPYSENLRPFQLAQLEAYLRTLPYDDNTTYQFVRLAPYLNTLRTDPRAGGEYYFQPGVTIIQNLITSRAAFESYLESFKILIGTERPVNFSAEHATAIMSAYAKQMNKHLLNARPATGVVILAMPNFFGYTLEPEDQKQRGQISSAIGTQINFGVELMTWLTRPPDSVPANAPLTPDPYGAFNEDITDSALATFRAYPAEVRMVLWNYYIPDPSIGEYVPQSIFNFTPWDTPHNEIMLKFEAIDALAKPILAIDSATNRPRVKVENFKFHFNVGLPYGDTMNPIHALREILTNKQWGQGIDESKINDDAFYRAATVCHEEGLDYCNAITDLNQLNRLVKDITDYVNGVLFYDHATDKVTIKLIREDYVVSQIPEFNETFISEIQDYKREHSKDLINSVTVRYHDAVKGSEETFTIHDLVESSRVGKVVSAAISFDGCATAKAAEVVGKRALLALSKSVISFRARISPRTQTLGLGDPVVVSYRDLGIERVVMRVSSISYGDGLTGGFSVHLIQDVFSDLITSDLVEPELPIRETRPPVNKEFNPFTWLVIEQASVWDLVDNGTTSRLRGATVQTLRHSIANWNLGLKYIKGVTDVSSVSVDGEVLKVSVGVLLTTIQPLLGPPSNTGLTPYGVFGFPSINIRVRISPKPDFDGFGNDYIRINDEVMKIGYIGKGINDDEDEYTVTVTARAQLDTVATGHAPYHQGADGVETGSDVLFLNNMKFLRDSDWHTIAHGSPDNNILPVSISQQGVLSRQMIALKAMKRQDTTLNNIVRATAPLPAAWVATVRDQVYFNQVVQNRDRGFTVMLKSRGFPIIPTLSDRDNATWRNRNDLRVTINREAVSVHTSSLDRDSMGRIVANVRTIDNDYLVHHHGVQPGQSYEYKASTRGTFGDSVERGVSWQGWDFSGIYRNEDQPNIKGWGFNWRKDWGSDDATGWNFNWDNNWGD